MEVHKRNAALAIKPRAARGPVDVPTNDFFALGRFEFLIIMPARLPEYYTMSIDFINFFIGYAAGQKAPCFVCLGLVA
jgi:hypothetical protein